jgi:uncharacterized delta-60 repeat protein
MKVSINFRRLVTLALPATCWALAATSTACSDDGEGTDDPSAGTSGSAGKGSSGSGSAGKTAGGSDAGGMDSGGSDNGGKTGGGSAGKDGEGGNGAEPSEGGEGGSGAEPGAGGAGGENPGPTLVHPAKLNGANGTLVPQVNDLRGVTFSNNGKIWAAGHVGANIGYPGGVDRQIAIVRFNGDGTLDSSFDGDGIKTFNLRTRQGLDDAITNDGDEYCMGIVELPSGDVVIQANVRDATGKGRDVVLLKMSASGSLINWSAGQGGSPPAAAVRKVDFGWTDAQSAAFPGAPTAQPTDESWGIGLSPDGTKIVVFGYGPAKLGALTTGDTPVQRTDNDRYVARVNVSNGAPDATFNGGVPFSFNSGGTNSDGGRRGNVEPDGSIISAGYTNIEGSNTIFVLRLSPEGVPDPTFTFGAQAIPGVFAANPFAVDGGIAECYSVKRQSTGRYVTTGYGRATKANGVSTFVPPWLTTDNVDLVSFGLKQGTNGGVLDDTFGVSGTLAIQSEALNMGGTEDRGRDLVVLPDDRLVYAGRLGTAPALFVTTADGELDPSEGGALAGPSGTDTIPGAYLYAPLSGSTSHFYAIALSPDKKRVAAVTNNHADGALLAVLSVE